MDSRPPPPQGAPPSYTFVTRMYRKNLRPVVMIFAFLAGLWTLFSGIGFFRNASVYNSNNESKLGLFSIILGILYMCIFAIECFGLFAAATQKLAVVRIYAYLSILVFLIVVAVGLVRTIIHFTLKHDIINTCTAVNTGDTVYYTGIFGPVSAGTLDSTDASDWCGRSWDRDSWSEIITFLITSVLAAFFSVVVFNYFRQVLDPTSPANSARDATYRLHNYPSNYNPPYNPSGPPYGQQGNPFNAYPAPNGPPPGHSEDAFVPPYPGKPPGYMHDDDSKDGYGDQNKGGGSNGDRV